MRLWSLHPQYLDAKGLVALWREALLAKNVLEGNTRGYRHHPQLQRFKTCAHPIAGIHQYLAGIYEEAVTRGYSFDLKKIEWDFKKFQIPVTSGQVNYETQHLLRKLEVRDEARYKKLKKSGVLIPHPFFVIVEGSIEPWEIVTS